MWTQVPTSQELRELFPSVLPSTTNDAMKMGASVRVLFLKDTVAFEFEVATVVRIQQVARNLCSRGVGLVRKCDEVHHVLSGGGTRRKFRRGLHLGFIRGRHVVQNNLEKKKKQRRKRAQDIEIVYCRNPYEKWRTEWDKMEPDYGEAAGTAQVEPASRRGAEAAAGWVPSVVATKV